MGGTMHVTSTVGEGSSFSFTIPLRVSEGETVSGVDREKIRLSGVRTLVVDDNQTNRRIVREMLGAVGITVEEAEEADSGLAMLREAVSTGKAFDLAVIDGHMPGRDGFEMAEIIRGDPVLQNTRMMLLTSGARKGDGQRCREIGVQAYLTKPVSRADLLEATVVILAEMQDGTHSGRLITRHSIEETRRRRRILLAEDNPVNQKVASTMLQKRGHTVDVVANGAEAVEAVREQPYDIVLMDIQMPTMDGISAVKEIRADGRFADLPVIALTAHALEGDEERFLEAGMNGYLSKPFRPHELYAVVEEWTSEQAGDTVMNEIERESGPPVDLDSFRETMREAGAEDAVESMLELFLDDAPDRIEALLEAAESGEAETIAKAAHAYKSASATIGATGLAATLNSIEHSAKEGDLDSAIGRIEQARTQHEAVVHYLREQTT
jgi:CheY-like chemotaxis protein/HPt (histidine-containing phosphotransfer) domain-containing protein